MCPWTEVLFLLPKLDKRGHHSIPPTCTRRVVKPF
jgi:hypothetical protein